MSRMVSLCVRRRRRVILGWVVVLVGLIALGVGVGTRFSMSNSLSGTQSAQAGALLSSASRSANGDQDQIVVHATAGTVTDAATRARVTAVLSQVARATGVRSVVSPYDRGAGGQISADRRTAYALVDFTRPAQNIPVGQVKHVLALAKTLQSPGLQVAAGGQAIENTLPASAPGLLIGVGAAAILLILVFGSWQGALLTLINAIVGLGVGVMVIGLLSHVISMPSFSSQLAELLGLGVGVDYSLFIATRYRQALMRGVESDAAILEALNTSGRAVLFGGITVCIALLSLVVLGVTILSGAGIATAVVVIAMVLASTTFLPALLSVFGQRILSRRARRALRDGELVVDDESPAWARWAHVVARRPGILAAAGVAVMLIIAIPFLSLRQAVGDAGSDPPGSTTRQAYDLLARGFGPGVNGPLQLVATATTPVQARRFDHVLAVIRHTPDVVTVSPASIVGHHVNTATVTQRGSPQDTSTYALLSTLRHRIIPDASAGTIRVLVGGETATSADFSSVISAKLPVFIGLVIVLALLLLTMVFRSLAIPVMGAVLNLISVGAAFGVITAVFQFGWLGGVIGVHTPGPINPYAPVLIFATLFGLSMDYQVFLLSRIREEWAHRRDATEAVVHGQAATGRTITAAAAIMFLVFAAFVLGDNQIVKLFGVGLAAAILLDVLVIRCIVLPGLLVVIGQTAWRIPARLDRLLPHISIDGPASPQAVAAVPGEPIPQSNVTSSKELTADDHR